MANIRHGVADAFVRSMVLGMTLIATITIARAQSAEVKIDNFTFTPPQVTVKAGSTITWTNADDIPHTVVAKERQFRSKALDTDETFSFTFTTPGVYEYFCSLHPHMTGKIVVEATTGGNVSR